MNRAFSKIWIVIILLVLIAGGFFAWKYLKEWSNPNIIFATGNSVWAVRQNGADLRKIYQNNSWTQIGNISLSPDNKKIAILADIGEGGGLFTMNSDFSNLQKADIKDFVFSSYTQPIWSPDNNNILLVGAVGKSESYIYRYNFKTKELIKLTSGNEDEPQLSSDGKKIIFTSFNDLEISWDLYIMDADGGNKKLLIANKDCFDSAWSPSGNEIVVNCSREGLEIFSYPDFKFKSYLVKSESIPADLQWAQNGKIYFSWDVYGDTAIHSINPDTKQESVIENPIGDDLPSFWSHWQVVTPGIKLPQNTILETKNQGEIADWKTYRNEKYGFEIKYPENYFTEEFNDAVGFADEKWKNQGVHNPAVYIYVIKTNLSSNEWLEENGTPISIFCGEPDNPCPDKSYLFYGVDNIRQANIDNIPVLQFQHYGASGSNKSTLFKKEPDVLYKIDAHSSGMGVFPQDVYDQMLSTFRF